MWRCSPCFRSPRSTCATPPASLMAISHRNATSFMHPRTRRSAVRAKISSCKRRSTARTSASKIENRVAVWVSSRHLRLSNQSRSAYQSPASGAGAGLGGEDSQQLLRAPKDHQPIIGAGGARNAGQEAAAACPASVPEGQRPDRFCPSPELAEPTSAGARRRQASSGVVRRRQANVVAGQRHVGPWRTLSGLVRVCLLSSRPQVRVLLGAPRSIEVSSHVSAYMQARARHHGFAFPSADRRPRARCVPDDFRVPAFVSVAARLSSSSASLLRAWARVCWRSARRCW
jgi:hypothetical protein